MKLERKDLLPLRLPAASLVASLVAVMVLIDYTGNIRLAEAERVRAARVTAEEASRRFRDSDLEKAMISQYLPQYRELQERGFIGAENRVNWIDALRVADQKAGNFGVQYQLSAQGRYEGLLSGEPIASRLRRSSMDIRFGVVHEGQFLAFLEELEAQRAGMYTLRSCSLEPAHGDEPQPRTANLNARCQIDWVTLVPPEGGSS